MNFKEHNFILYSIVTSAITMRYMTLKIWGTGYFFPYKNLNFCTKTKELTLYATFFFHFK